MAFVLWVEGMDEHKEPKHSGCFVKKNYQIIHSTTQKVQDPSKQTK